MNIAVLDHNPVNQVEATSVARQVGPKSGEMPLGKAGFAMKSSRDLWFWLLVLGFLVFPCSVVSAAEDKQVESSFLAFQKSWIQKLNKEGRYGEKSMRVEHKNGIEAKDYFNPQPGHVLDGYRETYMKKAMALVDEAHARVGSKR